ncbi:hypothetical protein Mycsm_04311 [Mycobacterium sp. JS623]|uniref:hypothetical protein n=1 Tax=Mycobacterium sp. JS623 TaxID=212767 RepID=UPI0002A5A185|nr:hypothetical protein [Mycobacterium sp. JS623]AGB24558.1 hypothetical protein Mycsm_04311 [Mycobacterium sp. JS623]
MTSIVPTSRTPQFRAEYVHLLHYVTEDDFTDEELQMMSAIVKGAIERRDRPAPVLQLVRRGIRNRGH